MELDRTRGLLKVKFRDLILTEDTEINDDLKTLMNESNMEIAKKHTNKDFTYDISFRKLERPTKQEFYREYKKFDEETVVYYAVNNYKMSREEILAFKNRFYRRYRRMDMGKLEELFKNEIISKMYNKYSPFIKQDYVEKFKKNIKSKLLTFMARKVSQRDLVLFRRALNRDILIIEIIYFVDDEIKLSIELVPRFNPRVVLDAERRRTRRTRRSRTNRTNLDQFMIYEQAAEDVNRELNRQLEQLGNPDLSDDFPPLGVSVVPDVNDRIEQIVQTQQVTESGNNLNQSEREELDRRLSELTDGEPSVNDPDNDVIANLDRRLRALTDSEPLASNPSNEVMADLDRRLEAMRTQLQADEQERRQRQQQQEDNYVDDLETRFNALVDQMSTDSDLRNELEQLTNQNGGAIQSKMLHSLSDDSSDDELPQLSSDAESDDIDYDDVVMDRAIAMRPTMRATAMRRSDLYDLKGDELAYLLNSIKLNNGCNDVINFCRTSKQLSGECLNIEEIRVNIYLPCLAETMIININKYDIYPEEINRKELLDREKRLNGTIEEFINRNLNCSPRLKAQLLYVINESLKQVPYFTHNLSQIPISFLIFMITSVKDILSTNDESIFDTYRKKIKKKTKPLLEYQLANFEQLTSMGVTKEEIYMCFIEYLRLLLNYSIIDLY
tara:strand:+ start:1144 stop:3153 length:2010 start_codon:yes stop_codon:yes gene_type:complete